MKLSRRARALLALLAGTSAMLLATAGSASAQVSVDPTNTPVKNKSPLGPLAGNVSIALLLTVLGLIVVAIMVILYMRYAPRFSRDEESWKVVRADRVVPGKELPRRAVDLSQAAPVVVEPPPVPSAQPAMAAAAAPAPALAAGGVSAAQAPAAGGVSGSDAAPRAASASTAEAAAPVAESSPAPPPAAPAAPPAAAPTPAPPAAPTERVEVTMDQAVYDKTLEELLAAGTDRRIAEGKAKRAGMIAAKKAAGQA